MYQTLNDFCVFNIKYVIYVFLLILVKINHNYVSFLRYHFVVSWWL